MIADIFRLDDKVAVVTGGGRGVGKMIAAGLLGAGAKVYLASRKPDDLDAAVAELSPTGEVHAVTADLGTAKGVATLTGHLADRESGVNALFNNAGASWGSPFEQFPESAGTRSSTSTSRASSCSLKPSCPC